MSTKRKNDNAALDKAINEGIEYLDPNDDNYLAMIAAVERLHKLKKEPFFKRVSPDTALLIAANIVGILVIVHYEQANVVTSKALGFVSKLK